MLLQTLLLLAGLALVIFGADWLVDGASSIARRLGISDFVIGLTIIGFGTSCPELVVSVTGAIEGISDVAIGNVIGSNIFNVLANLGIAALIAPVAISSANLKRDIPIVIAATVLMIALGMIGGCISRIDAAVMLVIFAGYIWYCFKSDSGADEDAGDGRQIKPAWAVCLIVLGLAGLIFGGQLFVDNAVALGHSLGVSEKFIAITVLAGGTSLPELATCVVAMAKKKSQMALGNILGSNVFNILLILGCAGVISPISFANVNLTDCIMLMLSIIVLPIFAFTGKRNNIDRWEGGVMLTAYIGYIVLLYLNM